ncbi:MAG: hypothetical protein KME03_08850 [Aphanocapsa lilacina HA4352-LM1]|jgi:hypothetical protein|nr:hypothetical protein [Aphanocapsa lilacina HA4352-LM1]
MRSGQFVKQASGYRAFVPATFPPELPIPMEAQIIGLLSDADQALERLDGTTFTE